MPGRSGVTVVTNSCVCFFTHEAAGASRARHSLRPLNSRRRDVLGKTSRASRGEIARPCLYVAGCLKCEVSKAALRHCEERKRRNNCPPSFRDGAPAPDLRCAIAHRGISRFRVRCFASPRNDGVWVASLSLAMTFGCLTCVSELSSSAKADDPVFRSASYGASALARPPRPARARAPCHVAVAGAG
jgi:hypothetical protein